MSDQPTVSVAPPTRTTKVGLTELQLKAAVRDYLERKGIALPDGDPYFFWRGSNPYFVGCSSLPFIEITVTETLK